MPFSQESTDLVSSMLGIALSKPEKLYKFLDPRNPNKAIRCKNYQIPTIEEVVIRFRFKFTVVDARDRSWQKPLDRASRNRGNFAAMNIARQVALLSLPLQTRFYAMCKLKRRFWQSFDQA